MAFPQYCLADSIARAGINSPMYPKDRDTVSEITDPCSLDAMQW